MLKDNGVDPMGGIAYSRYERTRVERVYKQAIDKEDMLRQSSRLLGGPPRFTMNCLNAQTLGSMLDVKHRHSRLEVISDKVEKASPQKRASAEGFDKNSMEVRAQRQAEKIPAQKTDLPVTRAQEVGWLLSHPASHGYIQHRRRQKDSTLGSSLAAEGGDCTQAASPSSGLGLRGSSSAPALQASASSSAAEEPFVPLGQAPQGVNQLNSRRFYKPKSFCPITKYADTYMSLMHHDPFKQSQTR